MPFFWSWRWVCRLEIKGFDLTGSRMPMLVPARLSFWPLELIFWTVLICIVMPAGIDGLNGHVGPWIRVKSTVLYEVFGGEDSFSLFEFLRCGPIPIRIRYVYCKWTVLVQTWILHKINTPQLKYLDLLFLIPALSYRTKLDKRNLFDLIEQNYLTAILFI